MKKIFIFCFGNWWRPLFLWLTTGITFSFSILDGNEVFQQVAFYFLVFALLVLLIAAGYHFAKRKWLIGFLHFFVFGGTIAVFFLFALMALFFIEQELPDTWADNLTIPTNIQLEHPVDFGLNIRRPDSVTSREKNETDFQLYNSFQPGLFEYDFWTGRIESGTVYLKAFEITHEYALSTNRLPESSAIRIVNSIDSIRKFGTTADFTIYEGDWGKPYAARFEVWFKPDRGGAERMLMKRNYIIEGWMR